MTTNSLLNEEFRPGSLYVLKEWSEISLKEKELLSGLFDESDVYGIFQPAISSPHYTIKIAYRDAALLYLHLHRCNTLPHYFLLNHTASFQQTLIRLVLDGVIEIKWKQHFISGSEATEALFIVEAVNNKPPNYLAKLSTAGIFYGLSLRNQTVKSLSEKLYTFNTCPAASFIEPSIKHYLFSALSSSSKTLLQRWLPLSYSESKTWLAWIKNDTAQQLFEDEERTIYKLYISPHFKSLPQVFNLVLPLLSSSEAISFKTGATPKALLRPDKMVAYFEEKESLFQTAQKLAASLTNYPAQGVPFSAQLDDNGMLSWGVDPPRSAVLEGVEAASWRCLLCDQLAIAVLGAQAQQLATAQAIPFIKAKLHSVGINSDSWTPVTEETTVTVNTIALQASS